MTSPTCLRVSSAMKTLAVFLTLVALAGSRAVPDSSPAQRDGGPWEYLRSVFNITQQNMDALRNSPQGQEIGNLIINTVNAMKSSQAELMSEARRLGEQLAENMQPHAQDLKEKVDVLVGEWQQKLLAAWTEAQVGLMERTEPLRQTLNNVTEELAQQVEQSTERFLGTSSEALKAKFRKDLQELRQKLQQQLQPRLRTLKATIQQITRKVSGYTEAFQSSAVGDFFQSLVNTWSQMFQ